MIEFDTCMATAERINPTILPSSHVPPPFYHHHHHHHHHHSLTGGHHHNNGGGGHSQVISDGQNGQIISHPRLNSLLTKSSAEQLSSPPLPPPPPSLPPLHHTPNPVHHTMNGHNHSNSSHHSGHHHNHNHNHNQQQHSTTTAKKVDRSSAACNSSSSVQQGQHHNQSAGKKHSQIVSKLQQSISSRLKQTGAAAAAAVAHQQHSESTAPLVHHSANSGATRPRTHSLPPPPPHSQPGNVGDMSAILSAPPHPPPPALMATKSNVLKISTTSNNSHGKQSQAAAAAVPPSAVSPNSLEDAKKKKKSHLSRDELSRVCQCGDVTFEAYNGSTYMIAIRSMGDRKSLIGYRCDWNACGYMNARVERMFGHIRSQHPEAPTVKKLVTTTGATMTTSTVTTTTSSGQDAAASAAAATTTTTNSTNMTTMSTTSSSSGCNSSGGTVSARLSLRSSSSLSTASSASSCSLSPRSSQKSGGNAAAANSSAHQSTLMSVLNGTGDVPVVKVVNNKRAHNKAHSVQGSKCSSVTNTATGGSSSALDALENITASMASQHEHFALPETSSQSMTVDASTASAAANASALKHTEEVDSEEKLMDLLNLSGDDISAQVKGEEGEQEMTMVKKEEEAVEEKMNLNCTTDSVTNSGLENSIATVNSDQLQQHIKVELNSPIDEMIAEANLDGDKLAALDPAELAETTEQIMQELKTISSNCEQQQSSVPSENILTDSVVGPNSHNNNNNNSAPEFAQHHNSPLNNNSSFPSPVDRNNNHHLGNGTAAGVSVNVQSAILEPQSSVMTNMCNGNETLMEQSSTTTGMQSLEQENNKIVDTLDLFDADIEQLLLNEQPEHHNDDQKLPNYPGDTFNLDGPKYAANSGEQQVMSANGQQQQPMQQHSSNGTFVQCQGQPQVTPPPALLQQHNQQLPPMAPMINTTSTNGPLHVEHPIQQTPDYDDYHNLSEFSFDSINGVTGDGSMMDSMNGHELGEKLLHRGQSVGSEHMHMYGDDAEAGGECFDDMESGMHDDGSNGSGGSSSAGSGKGSRTGKKTGSSKNYIGKQNLFQEFQSEDVAKVRDSENQYIIALQKNMKIVGYRCDWPECEFLTCRKYVMVNHINGKHTNQRPYSCPLCNFNFVKRYFLKAHMHKVHKRRISIDGKDDDDDMPPSMRGDKRDHELMMDSFDDNQFEGIPDTPETPNTTVAVAASSAIVPPVVQSNKKSKSQQKSEPPAYPASAMSNGSSSGYYSNGASMTDAYCPPMVANGPGGEFGGVVGSGEIPATVQQYSNYSSGGTGYGPHHQHHSSVVDPMLSGRGQMNGYYSDDAYGSNLPVQSGNAMACNTTAAASYKSNGGQMNSGNATGHHHQQQHHQHQHQQSAVFMTPSPSSSVASPLSFPTTGSAGTPNQKCSFPSQVSMYDNFGDSSTMQYNTAGNGYAQQQPQQPPFISRSYSQSSQSSGSMYGNSVSGKSPLSSGMMNTADLLTPPLSSGGTPTQGNCCRSGSIGGSSSAGRMSATPNTAGAACYPQDNFNSNSFSSEGLVSGHTYQNSGSFDDFLSPPSSISSSNSNFSGYMNSGGNMCGVDQQQQQQHQSSATTQRGQQASTPASASMANASSFYLHTPSPSPSSLSHSPASAPVYGNTAAAVSSSYNNNMSSSSQTPSNNHQYQTNFSNAFPNSADLTGNNNSSSGNSAAMVNQSPSHSSYQAQPSHQSKSTFPQSHASFASQQQQQQSMRPVQSQTASYNNNSQSMQYGNAYDGSGYFDQHNTESAYPTASGRSAAAKSAGPSSGAAASAASANSANSHFYGNHFAPMNPTSGLFDSYADSYPVTSSAAPKQQMYPGGGHHQQMPSAAAQAQTTFNGAQYW